LRGDDRVELGSEQIVIGQQQGKKLLRNTVAGAGRTVGWQRR